MKPHYSVVAAIIEKNGKYFCVQRGKTRYSYTSYKYEFPGGKIEPGETGEEALKREIREELGVDIEVKRPVQDITHGYPDFSVSLSFYLCTLSDHAHIQLLEHRSSVWADAGNIRNLDWVMADKLLVDRWNELFTDHDV